MSFQDATGFCRMGYRGYGWAAVCGDAFLKFKGIFPFVEMIKNAIPEIIFRDFTVQLSYIYMTASKVLALISLAELVHKLMLDRAC